MGLAWAWACALTLGGTGTGWMAEPVAGPGQGQGQARPHGAGLVTNDLVRASGPGLYEIGDVRLDQGRGTLSFPASVNLREGAIEYVLVADHGKIHESLLRTAVAPYHVQLALLLLGATAQGTNAVAPSRSGRASVGELTVEISWVSGRRTRRFPAGHFVRDRRMRTTIGRGQWFFVGSRFREDGFAAQADGSIIAVIDDPDAIIGSRRPGSDDDDNWLAVGKRLPPMDTPVVVTIVVKRPVSAQPRRERNP